MFSSLLFAVTFAAAHDMIPLPIAADLPAAVAARIDSLMERHWKDRELQPAPLAPDSEFLRRVTLDLLGRVPTYAETLQFTEDGSPDRRERLIQSLLRSPEFALHLGRVLDDITQEENAGDADYLEYLRTAVASGKPWDVMFREILLGPWDKPETKGADRFLTRRAKSLDDLTNDTTRVFFGVNVSCAKCHDHPLVADWTQDHYYGMASFFNRTQAGKGKGKNESLSEKNNGDVMFVTTKGERRTAKVMFLSGRVVEEPKEKNASFSRREALVKVALEEKKFFSRAVANQLWAYFMGRGLVHPVDQMHSANPPTVPGVLELLAEDLVGHNYDLRRMVAAIVRSRVYQLATVPEKDADTGSEGDFAVAQLRPLTPQQLAFSLLLATGDESFSQEANPEARGKRYRDMERQATRFTGSKLLDPRTDRYQSSTGEALFLSNHAEVQKLTEPAGKNLTARLAETKDADEAIDTAFRTVLSRAPRDEERKYLAAWLADRKEDRARACGQLVWALVTSAEFRFIH